MSNYKHRRRTSKKLPSSSSGEDEKVTGGHRVSKDKSAKRQESGNNHDRPQQKECPPPSSKDKSNSRRHFKEAVYKLSKTQSSEQRPVENEVTGGHRVSKDKNAKRQESGNNHDGPQQKECPPSSKDKSNSHRHFKEAVYKLPKTQSSEQRPVENEVTGGHRVSKDKNAKRQESGNNHDGPQQKECPPSSKDKSNSRHFKEAVYKLSKIQSSEKRPVENEVTGGHRVSKDKNAKRQESGNNHDGPQQKECPPPSSKDKSNSRRHFKEAVYKLSKTQSSEQRPVENEVGRSGTKTVDIPSRRTKSDPSDQTVDSGLSQQRSSHSKDARRQTTETTAKHDPHIKSSQKVVSSKSIRPAEYKPPPLTSTIPKNACKRKADAARGTTEEPSTTAAASSAKKSKAKEGWKEFDKPQKVEKGDPAGAKHSLSAPPRRTTRWASISTTRTTSAQKPKQPSLTPSQGHVTPLSPCVQGAGGSLTPSRPPVQFKIPKKTPPTSSLKCDVDNNAKEHNEKGGVSTCRSSGPADPRSSGPADPRSSGPADPRSSGPADPRSSGPADSNSTSGVDPKETGPVQSVPSAALDPFPSSPRGQDGNTTVWHQPTWRCTNMPPSYTQDTHDEGASITDDNDHEMQAVEAVHQAVHQARNESSLEVQSYGELTRMDTDAPDNGDNYTFKNDVILVLDTNILLSHLDYVKKIRSHGLGGMGFAVVLVPWVVLQELDALKNSKRPESSVAHLATPAVDFIYSCLKRQEPRLWGQSMQQASEGNRRLNAENNDDRVLQCCLQYQTLYPESALILCTNDKNLCSKALLSRVKALCKADLEEKSGRLHHDTALPPLPIPLPRHLDSQDPSSGNRRSGLGPRAPEKEKAPTKTQSGAGGEEPGAWGRRVCLCVARLEDCLKEALSHILEVEMKAAYEDLWKDIVYLKPPWELPDVLRCMRKHWIAVFGNIVPRGHLQAVENLHDFFTPGKTVAQDSVLAALREAGELLDVFGKTRESYGGRVSTAIGTLVTIERQLLARPEHVPYEPLVGDAVMSDREEKQAPPPQVSHQDVWALFENIWANLCQISSAMFAALHFDPGAMRSVRPEGAPPPPEDALACLHNLLPMVTQLLQAFSRVLSSDVGMEESQALLSFIHASQIVSLNTRLSTSDLIVCFSQQEYREKLGVGGAQLKELEVSLENCVAAMMNQSASSAAWL